MTLPSIVEYPFQVRHVNGCGGLMFFLKRRISRHEPLRAVEVIYPDGRRVESGSVVRCMSCGSREPYMATEWIEERSNTVKSSVWTRFAHGGA